MAAAVASVAAELVASFVASAPRVLPWAALYIGLHVVAEFGVPAVAPSLYAPLGRKDGADARACARDARTRIVATVMALHVTVLSLWGLFFSAEDAALASDLYGTTPLTRHLVDVAVGYFCWDVAVVLLDRMEAAFLFHGVACLAVFTGALPAAAHGGFLHHMALVTLLFEASTPLMHARQVAIKAGASERTVTAVSLAFMVVFLAARIVNGYSACWRWWWQVEALIASGKAHSVPLVRMYQVLCLGLSGLNGWWAALMLKAALCGRSRSSGASKMQKQQRKLAAGEAEEDPSAETGKAKRQ